MSYFDSYLDETWRQPYNVYWEHGSHDLGIYKIHKGLTGRIKLASFESLQAPEADIPTNRHLRLYRIMLNSLEYKDCQLSYVNGSSIGAPIPEYVFNVKTYRNTQKYCISLNIKIDLIQKLEWSQEVLISDLL
jgi:hypothetical protein